MLAVAFIPTVARPIIGMFLNYRLRISGASAPDEKLISYPDKAPEDK